LSSKAKRKGTRVENEVVKLFKDLGFEARRQPMSGALMDFPHDVHVHDLFEGTNIEVKARNNGQGFAQLDNWKGGADILILKKDFEKHNVYVEWDFFKELLYVYRQHRFGGQSREQKNLSNKLGRTSSSKKDSKKGTFKIPSREFNRQPRMRQDDRKSWSSYQRKVDKKTRRQAIKDARAKLQAQWRGVKDISQV